MDDKRLENKAKHDAKAELTLVSEHFKECFNAVI